MQELDFLQVKQYIETELQKIQDTSPEIPQIQMDRGEIKITFFVENLSKETVFDCLGIIKKYIEHIRIHTFDSNYIIFQSLGKNLYEIKNYLNEIKFKFIIMNISKVEVTKTGNLSQEEVLCVVEIIKFFYKKNQKFNFLERLHALGTKIYRNLEGIKQDDRKYIQPINDTWDDLGGYEEVKQEIQETVILPLLHQSVFLQVSELSRGKKAVNFPKAVLFEGPPGVGKTSMARIIASESGIPMVYIPIENILSKYYGESARNLSEVFELCEKFDRVLLFLDEIDSLATSREHGIVEATRRVLSVLLRRMDGLENNPDTLIIGATNRAGDLDPALLSRFDVIIHFPLPNKKEREQILRKFIIHLNDEEITYLSEISEGFSGRNLKDVCEMAERKWSRILILEKRTVTPPPFTVYIEAINKKRREIEGSPSG